MSLGVKETKEVITLAGVIAVELVKAVKADGFQIADLGSVIDSAGFKAAIAPALEGVQAVPAELTDISVMEGLELGKHVYDVATNVIAAIKG